MSVIWIIFTAWIGAFIGAATSYFLPKTWPLVLKLTLAVIVAIVFAAIVTPPVQAADATQRVEKPTDWATWSPPGFAKAASPWQPLGANARGVFYLSTYVSPMLGYTFTLKQVSRGLSGGVTTVVLDDFSLTCGPKGEPPDTIGAIGMVAFDARSREVVAQVRSDQFRGDPTDPVPGSVLARAVIVACYQGRH